ncbi:hypothetical protein D3C81_2236550 [compost metagenome]
MKSPIKDDAGPPALDIRPLRTTRVEVTVTKKVQISNISSSLMSATVSKNPARIGEMRYLEEPAT